MSRYARLMNWRVVLVSPQTAENVGAAARVMKNFGCTDLALVEPRCVVETNGPAGHMARSACDVLLTRRTCGSLEEALADCTYSVALTLHESPDRPRTFEGLVPMALLETRPAGERAALVFGREDRGLTNEECGLCAVRWCLPTDPESPSLNLAQAVALSLAGVHEAETRCHACGEDANPELARHEEVEGLMEHIERTLTAARYERGVPLEYPIRALRRLAARAQLEHADVQLLRGICRRLLNAVLGYERRP